MRGASTRAALVAVARTAAVGGTPRGWGAFLATVRGGCASPPALGGSVGFPSWLGWAAAEEAEAVKGDAKPLVSSSQLARGVAHAGSLESMSVGLYAPPLRAGRLAAALLARVPRLVQLSTAARWDRPRQAGPEDRGVDDPAGSAERGARVALGLQAQERGDRVRRLAKYLTDPSQKTLKSARLGKRARAEGQVKHVRAFLESDQDKATFQLA
eukprot:CAMPEP_0181371880 /NCGR_PEP_ID=MMETSP1106-20121128/14377_1 /TAXON_ID=81844 /ORGANISM="Mantoniella antarctica, Strain SL-175" /LENGTH=212 /DNA_ID=CAMNT_0023489133 /DNA_START=123 /DNA_END=757 /DNA_ORIENTATION=+